MMMLGARNSIWGGSLLPLGTMFSFETASKDLTEELIHTRSKIEAQQCTGHEVQT